MSFYKFIIGKDMAPQNKNTSHIYIYIYEKLKETTRGTKIDTKKKGRDQKKDSSG